VVLRSIELMKELVRSLAELDLGLKGDLQMSERMEVLQLALAENRVPSTWEALAYPSKRPLGMWFLNFIERHRQLSDWTAELGLPKLTWISGLFNPQSFLTAIMQTSARKNDWPLDKMVVQTEVTKKLPEEIQVMSLSPSADILAHCRPSHSLLLLLLLLLHLWSFFLLKQDLALLDHHPHMHPAQHILHPQSVSKDGAYVHGMTLEGARWDDKSGMLDDSLHKELFAKMPVTLIRVKLSPSTSALLPRISAFVDCPEFSTIPMQQLWVLCWSDKASVLVRYYVCGRPRASVRISINF